MKKHILVISQYFYPEQFRINDICAEWVKRGYEVTVLTGIPNYPEGKFYEGYGLFRKRKEVYTGINIIRVPIVPRGKNALMLAINYLSFVISGFLWQLFSNIKVDYVFIFEVSPMTQALPGVWYAEKRRIPCYIYVQDLWPENVEIIAGVTNRMVLNSIGHMVDYIYKRCDKIFVTSNSFARAIHQRGVDKEKLDYFPQYAEDFYKPQAKAGSKENLFKIIFAGNIGEAQGLDILPKVANVLAQSNLEVRIVFNIVGDGRYMDKFIELIDVCKVPDMFKFIPRQPAEKIPAIMAENDVAFLCLTDNPLFAMTIPAKLQSYLACGMPILACASGETAKILENSGSGFASTPGDVDSLAKNILRMAKLPKNELQSMGFKGREYYDQNFAKDVLLDKMDAYFTG